MNNESSEFVGVRMPKDMLIEIAILAKEKMSSQSQIIREATKKGLPLIK